MFKKILISVVACLSLMTGLSLVGGGTAEAWAPGTNYNCPPPGTPTSHLYVSAYGPTAETGCPTWVNPSSPNTYSKVTATCAQIQAFDQNWYTIGGTYACNSVSPAIDVGSASPGQWNYRNANYRQLIVNGQIFAEGWFFGPPVSLIA